MEDRTYQLTRPRGTGYAVTGFSRACLIRLIDFPEMPLRTNVHETVKAGGTALLVRTEFPFEQRQVQVAYKRVRRRNWWKVLTGLLRTNRLLRTWRLGRALLAHDITTPKPLAVIVPRWFQVAAEAYLAIEWIDGASNLRQVVSDSNRMAPQRQRTLRRRAAIELGKLLARMHEARVSHRDLKATNLLLKESAGSVETYVIDLDGARQHHWQLSWHLRLCNLSRLELSAREQPVISRSDRLRLLRAYLAASSEPKPHWKTAWRQLGEIADSRASRHGRRAA